MQVKDLDIGLLDFPCVVGDDVILLCWKLGEKKYHALARDARKALPAASRSTIKHHCAGEKKSN